MASPLAPDDRFWYRLASRSALLTGLALMLVIAFFPFIQAASRGGLPKEFDPLAVFALREPTLFRLVLLVDSFAWFGLAGFLLAFAGLLAGRAPVAASIVAICGIAQIVGVIGAMARRAIPDLVSAYAVAAPDQQAVLLRSYLDLQNVVMSPFNAGSALRMVAFLVVAWVAWSMRDFPRWIAAGFGVIGLVALLAFLTTHFGTRIEALNSLRIALEGFFALAIVWAFWGRAAVPGLAVRAAAAL
ncbi:MAG: hypothetical protein AUH33_02740 [Chloroflexi bacterium 13_1_40CM_68_21]|nr:MAG: hypothetical protein AUH33_02740 [Chloroflexi bacterium 13_1_40CM_68_21]